MFVQACTEGFLTIRESKRVLVGGYNAFYYQWRDKKELYRPCRRRFCSLGVIKRFVEGGYNAFYHQWRDKRSRASLVQCVFELYEREKELY